MTPTPCPSSCGPRSQGKRRAEPDLPGCFQCDDAACVKVCPVEALTRNEATGAIEVNEARCIGCGLCSIACPFGHIRHDGEVGIAVKCDLCGGEPACAAFCPTKTLEYK